MEGDAKLDALAKELDPEEPWEHPRARELDTITFDEWLRAEVGDEVARENLRSYLADGFLTKPAYSFSLLQGLWAIAGAGGTYELFAPEQCLAFRVVGGSQLVPAAAWPRSSASASCSRLRSARSAGRTSGVEIDAGAAPGRGARGDRRGRSESRGRDPLLARAAGLADEAPAGELAGQRDEGPRRVPGAVLARRRTLRRGLRAAPARARDLRQHAAVGLRRRPLHLPPRRAGRVRRAAASRRGGGARPRGPVEVRRARRRSMRPTTSRSTGRGRSGRAARTRRRSASAASRASAPTCAAPSARSTGRARTSPASGTCTWRAASARASWRRPPCSPSSARCRRRARRTRRRSSRSGRAPRARRARARKPTSAMTIVIDERQRRERVQRGRRSRASRARRSARAPCRSRCPTTGTALMTKSSIEIAKTMIPLATIAGTSIGRSASRTAWSVTRRGRGPPPRTPARSRAAARGR